MTEGEEQAVRGGRWRALTLLAITLVLSMSTWFSASAVIPQLKELWQLSASASAWLTIAVQIGFVTGAVASSLFNLADIVAPRHVILGGAVGAALANALLGLVGGAGVGIPLRFATGFFLARRLSSGLQADFYLVPGWAGLALGVLAGAIVVGNGMPHLVNGLGGLDWRLVIYATSALTLAGRADHRVWTDPGKIPVSRCGL